jgi:polyferredoxin
LRNIWAQNFAFLAVALFSALILTSPLATALTLLGFILVSLLLSLLFERRAFCRYLCPIGGFVGVYGQMAPVAVRVKDPAVCASHTDKTCYVGSDAGYGCPYSNLLQKLETNTTCSMCGECLRTCNKDNIAFYVRMPGADLLDRAAGAWMRLSWTDDVGRRTIYSVVLIGTNGPLKVTARRRHARLVFAAALLAFNLVAVPGLFWLCVRAGQALTGKANVVVGRIEARNRKVRACLPIARPCWCRWGWPSGSHSRCRSL